MSKIVKTAGAEFKELVKDEPKPQLVKQLHMHIGADLIGSKTSLSATRGTVLTLTSNGVVAVNSNGRKILIPFSNIKCLELI